MRNFNPGKNLYLDTLETIRNIVSRGDVRRKDASPRLIFLCGANKPEEHGGGLSARRAALRDYIQNNISDAFVIIAEHFFDVLISRFKSERNLLDEEYFLSEIADDVLIVLESQSAFCELGAFAHDELRRKVVVINNKKFRNTGSFVNLGPIDAIKKSTKRKSIIDYDMSSNGITVVDGIGEIFDDVKEAIEARGKIADEQIGSASLQPTRKANIDKYALMFAADFVYFCASITYKELLNAYMAMFPDWDSYDGLKKIVSLLDGLGLAKYAERGGEIVTKMEEAFFDYGDHEQNIILNMKMCAMRRKAQNVAFG